MNKILAIRGNKLYSEKIIEVLETLGGNNKFNHTADDEDCFYYIDSDGYITFEFILINSNFYTFEDFLEKYPYTINDIVELKTGNEILINNMYFKNDTMYYDGNDDDGHYYTDIPVTCIKSKVTFLEDDINEELECNHTLGLFADYGRDILVTIDDLLGYQHETTYTMKQLLDRRCTTNLFHFEYCPKCGEKINWKELRKDYK